MNAKPGCSRPARISSLSLGTWCVTSRPTKPAPAAARQRAGVERGFGIAQRGGRREHALGGGGRDLAAGHAVDLVVEHQAGHLQVATAGVDQVVAADRQAVAVAADHDHVQVGPRQCQPGRVGEWPAVRDVEGVRVDVGRQAGPRTRSPRPPRADPCRFRSRATPTAARAARCRGRTRGTGSAASCPAAGTGGRRSPPRCRASLRVLASSSTRAAICAGVDRLAVVAVQRRLPAGRAQHAARPPGAAGRRSSRARAPRVRPPRPARNASSGNGHSVIGRNSPAFTPLLARHRDRAPRRARADADRHDQDLGVLAGHRLEGIRSARDAGRAWSAGRRLVALDDFGLLARKAVLGVGQAGGVACGSRHRGAPSPAPRRSPLA